MSPTAAAIASASATAITDGRLPSGVVAVGDTRSPTLELLRRVRYFGVRLQELTGVPQPS